MAVAKKKRSYQNHEVQPAKGAKRQAQAPAEHSNPVVQRLREYESMPKGSKERLQAFRKLVDAVYDEDGK